MLAKRLSNIKDKEPITNINKSSAIFYILLGFTLFLIIYPVSFLLFGSVWSGTPGGDGHFTLDNYRLVFSDPKTFELLVNSLAYAAGSALLGVSIATAPQALPRLTSMRNIEAPSSR